MSVIRFSGVLTVIGLLSACDPNYVDTANQCAAGETNSVRAAFNGYNFDTNTTTYKPYLTDIYVAMQLADGEVLQDDPRADDLAPGDDGYDADADYVVNPLSAADKQTLIDNIISRFNQELGYTTNNEEITSVNNPVEFVEYLIASEDPGIQIDLFQDAKNQIQNGINNDDGFCKFENYNIVFESADAGDPWEIIVSPFRMFYEPFDGQFDYFSRVEFVTNPDEDNEKTAVMNSTNYMSGEIFTPDGYTEPDVGRALTIFSAALDTRLDVNDLYTNTFDIIFPDERDHLGKVDLGKFNTSCVSDPDEDPTETCADGITTKAIERAYCRGEDMIDDDGNPLLDDDGNPVVLEGYEDINETDQIQVNSIDLGTNTRLMGVKRVTVETDYDSEQVSIYVSKYNEAIRDSNGEDIIENPTACERAVVEYVLKQKLIDAGEDDAAIDLVTEIPEHIRQRYKARLDAGATPEDAVFNLEVVQRVEDPNYDDIEVFVYDEDGNVEFDDDNNPVRDEGASSDARPVVRYTGVALPERKSE